MNEYCVLGLALNGCIFSIFIWCWNLIIRHKIVEPKVRIYEGRLE